MRRDQGGTTRNSASALFIPRTQTLTACSCSLSSLRQRLSFPILGFFVLLVHLSHPHTHMYTPPPRLPPLMTLPPSLPPSLSAVPLFPLRASSSSSYPLPHLRPLEMFRGLSLRGRASPCSSLSQPSTPFHATSIPTAPRPSSSFSLPSFIPPSPILPPAASAPSFSSTRTVGWPLSEPVESFVRVG